MKYKPLVIFGSGGHALSVANVALSLGYKIQCFVSPKDSREFLHDIPIVSALGSSLANSKISCAVAVGDNYKRMELVKEIKSRYPNVEFPSLVHASSSIGFWSSLGMGSVVMQGGTVGANCTVGEFSVINTNATFDHDSSLGDFASIAPGAIIGGKVSVGEFSAIGLGAHIKNGIKVGEHAVIGASSLILKFVNDFEVVYGVPAQVVRKRYKGEPYL
jgi:sugar O-acyltransferase (sialic acid O-acetyltransferase NeuD family)